MYAIVILSKNPVNAARCVMSIYQREPELPRRNIIVVDDGARDEAEQNCPNITWVDGEKPFIFSRNANIGIRHAFKDPAVDSVILLNDDALLQTKRGFTSMWQASRGDDSYGLLASSTNNVGNETQQPRGAKHIRMEQRMLCFVCVLIPRSTWDKVGELDEQFVGYGFDDDDYSRRVLNAGLRLGVWDGCYVDHSHLPSTFRSAAYPHAGFAQNQRLFQQKYGG